MRNVHILLTDKPSRLLLSKRGNLQFLKDNSSTNFNNHFIGTYQNIYITSDEEIKDGWSYDRMMKSIGKRDNVYSSKIILTTDQDLIKNGVQSIDDKFLEWFTANPSCEEVEVEKLKCTGQCWKFIESDYKKTCLSGCELKEYKIIIPQEEPKQEILEKISSIDLSPEFQQLISDNWDDLTSYEPKQETLDKKSLYIQDYKSRISALQYVIDFYEILTKEDIVKQKDDYSKQLKDLENE
jgi:hypothetical protein